MRRAHIGVEGRQTRHNSQNHDARLQNSGAHGRPEEVEQPRFPSRRDPPGAGTLGQCRRSSATRHGPTVAVLDGGMSLAPGRAWAVFPSTLTVRGSMPTCSSTVHVDVVTTPQPLDKIGDLARRLEDVVFSGVRDRSRHRIRKSMWRR